MFTLFNTLFAILAAIIDTVGGLTIDGLWYGFIYLFYIAFAFIPGLAVGVRRLHDIGKSGWMILISLIPIVGPIWLLVLMVQDSDPFENAYGPNPKGIEEGTLSSATPLQDGDVLDTGFTSAQSGATMQQSAMVQNDSSDIFILIAIVWMALSRLLWFILSRFADYYYTEPWFPVFSGFTNLIWACIPLALALAIKHPGKRMAMLIVGGLYLLVGLVEVGYNILG